MMNKDFNILIQKLDKFIRKYYLNQILKGFLIGLTIVFAYTIFISVYEYFNLSSSDIRTAIFYFSIVLIAIVFIYFILLPALKFLQIGKIIDYKQAARIISAHFSDIDDQLLNTLELADINNPIFSNDLLLASIDQKAAKLKPVPFQLAIKFKENYKYLRYFLLVFAIGVAIFLISPSIYSEGTYRIVKYKKHFVAEAPFQFNIQNTEFKVPQGEDFLVDLQIHGDLLPNNVYINYGSNKYLMTKNSKSKFSYQFLGLNNNINFFFSAGGFNSKMYALDVLPVPGISEFYVSLDFPEYTAEQDIELKNVGDLNIPAGTKVSWKVKAVNIDTIFIETKENNKHISGIYDEPFYVFNKTFFASTDYSIVPKNSYFSDKNTIQYSVNVIPDLYPDIEIETKRDSQSLTSYYYKGIINDDYGFTKLNFVVKANEETIVNDRIAINGNLATQDFYFQYDFSSLDLKAGQKVDYYFEVFDNDLINSPKSSRSQTFMFNLPSHEEIQEIRETANKNVQNMIQSGIKMANELKNDVNKLQQDLINGNMSEWEKSKMLENLNTKQKELQQLLKDAAQKNKEKNNFDNAFTEQEKDILEKQKQLEELMENLLTDELKDLIEQLNKLQNEMLDKKMNEMGEQLKMDYDELEKELDRNLEMLKKFEVEQKINSSMKKIEDLAVEQENLSEQSLNKKSDAETLQKKQDEQAKKFDEAMKEYKKALEMNKDLEQPMNLEQFEEMQQKIQEEFQKAKDNLQQNQRKKASKSQKQNAKNLSKMAQSMQQMMEQNQAEVLSKNMEELRQILENLVHFSFDQEKLINATRHIYSRDPKFVEIVNDQKKLSDNFILIKDSLLSLAKNTPQIGKPITKEVYAINKNLASALKNLEERRVGVAKTKQQFVMTSTNNLALLLSEILESLQKQQASGMSGTQQAQKPSNKKGSFGQMKKMQQSFKQQLEKMLQQMKNGEKGKNGKNRKNNSKQLAKMLRQQEMLNNILEKMKQNGELKNSTMKKLDEISKMIDENKRDIVKQRFSEESILRQQEIMTRLLEAEKSEQERELDKKRESKEAKELSKTNPKNFFNEETENKTFKEELELSRLKFLNYFQNKYRLYMLKLNKL